MNMTNIFYALIFYSAAILAMNSKNGDDVSQNWVAHHMNEICATTAKISLRMQQFAAKECNKPLPHLDAGKISQYEYYLQMGDFHAKQGDACQLARLLEACALRREIVELKKKIEQTQK